MTERELHLMDRFRKGDVEAFEAIFHLYHSRFCHFANVILKDPALSKDIVSQQFVQMWKIRAEIDSPERICQFFYPRIFFECLKRLRSGAIPELNDDQARLIQEATRDELEEILNQHALDTEILARLSSAKNSLPLEYRKIFKDYMNEVPVEETSRKTGYTTARIGLLKKRIVELMRDMRVELNLDI